MTMNSQQEPPKGNGTKRLKGLCGLKGSSVFLSSAKHFQGCFHFHPLLTLKKSTHFLTSSLLKI